MSKAASIIVELVDRASGPARAISKAVRGISDAAGMAGKRGFGDAGAQIAASANAASHTVSAMHGKLLAAVASGYALKQALAGTTGVAADFESVMLDIAQKGDLTDVSMKALGERIKKLAPTINQTAGEAAKSMDALMGLGLDQDRAEKALTPIGRVATAYKADLEDVSRAAFAAMDNLKVTPEQLSQSLDAMAQSGKEGAFELKDMARYFPMLTASAQSLKMKGPEAIARLSAALQIARKGAGTAEEAATNTGEILNKIISPTTTKKFTKLGVDIRKELKKTQEAGGDIFEMLAGQVNKALKGDLSKLGDIFEDKQAKSFLNALIPNLKEYQRIRDAAGSATGVVDNDFARRMLTAEAQTKAFTAGLNALGLSIGTILLPSLNELTGSLLGFVNQASAFTDAHPGMVGAAVKITASLVALKIAAIATAFAYRTLKASALTGAAALVATKAGLRAAALGMVGLLAPTRLAATALRGLRFALLSSGVGAGLVAIGTAGAFIYRNWQGLGKAFSSFGQAFSKALGPETADRLKPLFDAGRRVAQFFDDLTARISDAKWQAWGEEAGRAMAKVAEALTPLKSTFDSIGAGLDKITAWFTGAGNLFANTKRELQALVDLYERITGTGPSNRQGSPLNPGDELPGVSSAENQPSRPAPAQATPAPRQTAPEPMPDNRMLERVNVPAPPVRPGMQDLYRKRHVPLPPQRPVGVGDSPTDVTLPEISVQVDTGEVDAAKAKIEALNSLTVAPKGDAIGLAPLDAGADATKGKLSALDGITVSPKGDPSGLAVIEAACDRILGKLGQIGGKVAAAQGQVSGLSAAAGRAGAALSGLERSKQTSMTSSPA